MSDMRAHASMTIPLSSTRSKTSMRLQVLGVRLTVISGFAAAVATGARAKRKPGKTFSACLAPCR